MRISDARYDKVSFLDLENGTVESFLLHTRGNEIKKKNSQERKKYMIFHWIGLRTQMT